MRARTGPRNGTNESKIATSAIMMAIKIAYRFNSVDRCRSSFIVQKSCPERKNEITPTPIALMMKYSLSEKIMFDAIKIRKV